MFSCVLTEQLYMWKRVTDTEGTTPSPRSNHSCWVHRDRWGESKPSVCNLKINSKIHLYCSRSATRACSSFRLHYSHHPLPSHLRLIYFGGYGPKTLSQNTSSASFTVEEMTWVSTNADFNLTLDKNDMVTRGFDSLPMRDQILNEEVVLGVISVSIHLIAFLIPFLVNHWKFLVFVLGLEQRGRCF